MLSIIIKQLSRPQIIKQKLILNKYLVRNISQYLQHHHLQSPINHHNLETTTPSTARKRYKSHKGGSSMKSPEKKRRQSESEASSSGDDMDKWQNQLVDKSTKIMTVNVTSLRIDGLLKAGLGIARNKIDVLFYESKIRVNGARVLKKSAAAREGDEIDVVKGRSAGNAAHLTVARVEVLSVIGRDESISVKIRRSKSLTIDNYDDAWTPTTS